MNNNQITTEDAIYWILKEKEGFNFTEKEAFKIWIKDIENNKIYEQNKTFLNACIELPQEHKHTLENELKKQNIFFNNFKTLQALAASIIFILFISYTYYDNTKVNYEKQFLTTTNINTNINLPDKSIIDLDVQSKIKVTYYKNERLVKLLKGKAFFSVTKDINRPFIIQSGNTRIEVLGTKFEVINLNDINTINVIQGVVRVSRVLNDKVKNILILQKGDSLAISTNGKVRYTSKNLLKNIAAWKRNLLIFNKTTLKEALKKFNRYDLTKVNIMDYETSQLKVSGEFSTKDLDKFLQALPLIYPIQITNEYNKIKISKKI